MKPKVSFGQTDVILEYRDSSETWTKYGIFPHEMIPLTFPLRSMRYSEKTWHISARDYPIDIFTKIHARFGQNMAYLRTRLSH